MNINCRKLFMDVMLTLALLFSRPLAGYAQAFYSLLYGLDMDIEYLSQKTDSVNMFRYVTQRRSRDWIAYISEHLEMWEAGRAEEEAIENLRVSRDRPKA